MKEITNFADITKQMLLHYGLNPKKKFGQNFLINEDILDNIVDISGVSSEDDVIEIGPGIGALTAKLAKRAHKVLAVEIDHELISVLSQTLANYTNISILESDILKVDFDEVIKRFGLNIDHIKIVANLPYYITTPILLFLLKQKEVHFESITVMVQKEVAERMTSAPGNKDYGSLTLLIQYYMNAELVLKVDKTYFMPQPKVDSAVVNLTKKSNFVRFNNERSLFKVIRECFNHRRKNLLNNLVNLTGKKNKTVLLQIFDEMNIDKNIRAEKLTLKQFMILTDNLMKVNLLS
ncbi:MAG: 16S rRNA (adenine(1518)-N(6)/adenine(1519)-N(6))-dimethyltransferase RsmA [Firmicutes bacterium]|uniref:Ribosomal RNA small subunit methyltransferase A n=1 Tax=Candidatus Gallilactobacillus intestinavium TaxID=2840838 RepID=A0A9D9E574_9LACO|nr:16S rRNA (adenine(1518)-N(6)/adenine(1519)-N(6))-dimethyltransferase RsmA [Candidatus Gallilactobacillus intestinavium]